jgi:DNA-binding transcriptional ArsR family regulator
MGDVWSALADPTRRRILELLGNGDMTAGEIADNFNMAKPSISHHLSILKNADLVYAEKNGQNIIYSMNTTVFQDALRVFAKFAEKRKRKSAACAKKRRKTGSLSVDKPEDAIASAGTR